ncbi:hypothetical protein ASD00_29060 [Ensifer sp. Root31]|uniref:hypothetical protein n=1 Tax=Ensifer sp. Root31 TaxID=1736512 RepID=UPI00070EC182|nr:hypothetical protein [Ensifer sp. Root31]KQU88576.1 hypothetical protein ASD00_29060 [Ensifer sp. Root31]
MTSNLLSPMRISAFLFLSLFASGTVWAQAYVDQVNKNGGNKVYVDQMPSGSKPSVYKANSHAKTDTSRSSSRPGEAGGQAASGSGSSTVQRAVNDVVPTVGAGSSAIVRLISSAMDWPSVGQGTVSR